MNGTGDLAARVKTALNEGTIHLPEFENQHQAATNLRLLVTQFGSVSALLSVLAPLVASAAPDMALNNLERFLAATDRTSQIAQMLMQRDEVCEAMIALLAGSQFLSEVLIAQPVAFEWLIEENGLWIGRSAGYYREAAREQLEGFTDLAEQRRMLSRWRRREMLRVGMRDLLGLATMEEVTRDISDLAQAIIQVAAELTYQITSAKYGHPVPESASWDPSFESADPGDEVPLPTAAGMCVLGMGKLGGRELNFSSDIDLVFIYEAEGETTGRHDGTRRVAVVTNHVFFSRMGEALVKFLADRGPDGNLFRVDMRLRPEGQDGPLVRSLESFITYLSSQARDWERIAYLKARVMSGPSHLTERLYRVISRFVYAGTEPAQVIREVQELKLRIDREVMTGDLYEREVKRGYGGIREIEFVIAAMQIIHGYAHHALRVRNVFLAIQRLEEVHVLSDEEAMFYLRAYSFLRLIEHRLQMAEEHQTHTIPTDATHQEQLARRCNITSAASFLAEYRTTTHEVHRRFVQFFEEDVAALDEEKRDVLLITDRDAPENEVAAALARRGIAQPDAVRLVHTLAFGTREVFISPEGQRYFEQMLPSLLRMITSAPIPERVLPNLHSFAMAIKSITYYYEVMAQHPEILRLLVTLFGTSNFYSSALIAHPEYFDALISSRVLDEADDDGSIKQQRMRAAVQSKLPQRKLVLLRRATHFENLLTTLRYLLKLRTLPQCLRQLSDTADVAIGIGMQLGAERIAAKDAARTTTGAAALLESLSRTFAVIALGKYGGRELNFFGDLDVVFVFNDVPGLSVVQPGQTPESAGFYTEVADTLTAVLSESLQGGRAFVMDARLRPHGRNAPHATPLSQYVDYLAHEAEVWELQSLTRARLIWGEQSMLESLCQAAHTRVTGMPTAQVKSEILAMRKRLETAAADSLEPGQQEFKRAPGGIVDVEFLLQYAALTGSPSNPNYFEALRDPILEGAIPDRERLQSQYTDLRELETATRLVSDAGTSVLPSDATTAMALSRLMGLSAPEQLQAWLTERTIAVRAVFESTLGRPE